MRNKPLYKEAYFCYNKWKFKKNSKKMSIHTLMFGWEYPPLQQGGLGVACQGLVNGLLTNNTKVTLALPHPNPQKNSELSIVYPHQENLLRVEIESGLQPYDTPSTFTQRKSEGDAQPELYGKGLIEAVAYFTDQSVLMTKNTKPDIVHCHDWMTYAAASKAAEHHRVPMVAHIHATELDRTHFSPNPDIYECERKGFQNATTIIAVSQYTKNILVEHYGIPASKIRVVHNGNTFAFDAPAQQIWNARSRKQNPMVLFLGRMTVQKGPWQFLDMACRVHKENADVQFVIAGDGHMFGEMIDRACALGLQDCMIFAGKVNTEEARMLYKEASCFVMPSVSEPFGLVALEAAAHHTPVIVSKQSGVAEVLPDAFQVDFWDTGKMADYVLTVLEDQQLAQYMTSRCETALTSLTWQNQAAHVRSIYKDILSAS